MDAESKKETYMTTVRRTTVLYPQALTVPHSTVLWVVSEPDAPSPVVLDGFLRLLPYYALTLFDTPSLPFRKQVSHRVLSLFFFIAPFERGIDAQRRSDRKMQTNGQQETINVVVLVLANNTRKSSSPLSFR